MRYNVIAIEREYASGGCEIGGKLSEKLGIPCYGREILEKAADKIGLPVSRMSLLEESMTGSLLFSLHMMASITSGNGIDLTEAQKLAIAEADIIRNLSINPCVIIGRCAAGLMKNKGNALKVFIHADFNARIERAIKVYGIAAESAEQTLRRYDRRRADYFKTAAGSGWKDADAYHMFLNSGRLGIDAAVDILYSAVKQDNRFINNGCIQSC